MLKNYILIALRNIIRNKIFSSINIIGLALGMACTMVILLWIQDELNYDIFHQHKDRLYHAYLRVYTPRSARNFQSTTSHELAGAMVNEIPEIEEASRMGLLGEIGMKYDDRLFLESKGIGADANIFHLLTYDFKYGNPENALTEPASIVMTETFSKKYFGEENPVGKIIRINDRLDLTVSAVLYDPPGNTHREFDFLVPFGLQRELGIFIDVTGNYFSNCRFHTYVLMNEHALEDSVKQKVSRVFYFENDNVRGEVFLVPISQTNRFLLTGGDHLIYTFFIVSILILLIACINYVHMSTARISARAMEVGIRKVFGAGRRNLMKQFLGETLLISLAGMIIAINIVNIVLPSINNLTGKELQLYFMEPLWILIICIIWLITGFASGSYPAFLLSSLNPVQVIVRKGNITPGRSVIRKILVVTQFSFAAIFLISILFVSRQFYFMNHVDLGYNKENLVYIRLREQAKLKSKVFKEELKKVAGIKSITCTSHLPVLISGGYFEKWGRPGDEIKYICQTMVDYDYINTLELQMAEGRFFSPALPSDSVHSVVVNEMAINQMDLDDPIGKKFFYRGGYFTIIGIIRDFHHVPLVMNISPLLFRLNEEANDYILARINAHNQADREKVIHAMINTWEEQFPEYPIEYNFLEDYEFAEEKVANSAQKLMVYFTILAVLISCLGLYGLSIFMAGRRTREIGIRKVFGAKVSNVIRLLSIEYLKLVIMANIIAWPIGFLIVSKFLEAFAYRIQVGIITFILVGLIMVVLAVITIGAHGYKTALQNPAVTLRSE